VTHGKRTVVKTVDTKLKTLFEGQVIQALYTYFYSLDAWLANANLSCSTKANIVRCGTVRYGTVRYGTVRYDNVKWYGITIT